jgi:hypothetical protein
MEPDLARKMWRTLEPYHGMIYFTPRATEAYAALGIDGRAGYFASRAAPMGAVAPSVVVATFFNFNPALVEAVLPPAWVAADPAAIVAARFTAADQALSELLGGDVLASADLAEAADLARAAAEACTSPGRPLYAAHASLAWPTDPHLVLWHAITLLREYRGDAHVAALVVEGLDGCEALVTHGSAGAVPPAILQATRAWSDEEWAAAEHRLEARGWFADGQATPAGVAVRDRIERITDEQSLAPWQAIGADAADRLRALVRPCSRAIADSGVFLARTGLQA